ncbi:PilN domain-containing protein [Paucibacter sp. Y2R2-4]|uniref:PilN domain-containing protein n=1 Tax=Paucibacter sp. Y2R2-4 TaxID=2893553 RepID=UPI0021E36365|nr:PilN domain-containing protein [Paucibacter sp. Y2R2-4]MCV2349678.1 PilN domain-containing protein [Paucibacter sp. Y2R2-4]
MSVSFLNPPALRGSRSGMARPSRTTSWPQPDFMPGAQKPSLWMWAYLLLASLCLGLLLLQQYQLRVQAQQLEEQWLLLDQLSAQSGAARGTAATRGAVDASSSVNRTPELQARAWVIAAELRPELGKDWGSRWQALEQALPPGLQLQAMDLQGGSLRLEGSALEAERVMQLVDRLALQARSVPGSEVVLTRLQKPEGPLDGMAGGGAEAAGLRFEVVRRQASAVVPGSVLKGRG